MESILTRLEDFGHQVKLLGMMLVGFAARHAAPTNFFHLWALIPSYAINLLVSYKDYTHKEERLRDFYAPEIAAMLGKTPGSLTVDDLKIAGERNPIIGEAIARNKRRRNLDFIASSIAVTLVVAIVLPALALGPLSALFLSPFLFLGTEYVMDKIGSRMMGLSGPKMPEALSNPSLQPRLSMPGQIKYLEQLQSHINTRNPATFIRPEQVATAIAAINPGYSGGADINALTEDLNARRIRAQEIAFAAFGQASGVEKLDAPSPTMVEALRERLAATQQKLAEVSTQVKEKAQDAVQAVKARCFKNCKVSGVVPENQAAAQAALAGPEPVAAPPPQSWVDRTGGPRPAGASKVEELAAQRAAQVQHNLLAT